MYNPGNALIYKNLKQCLKLQKIIKYVTLLKIAFLLSSCGFSRNARKFGLGSLRRTPMEGIPHIIPGPHSPWTIELKPTTTTTDYHLQSKCKIRVFVHSMQTFLII